MRCIKFNDFEIFAEPLRAIDIDAHSKYIINTINPHSFVISSNDECFKKALQNSDILIPDGIGIVYSIRLLTGEKITKIAGYDLFIYLLDIIHKNNLKCFFLGSSHNTLKKLYKKLQYEYPNIKVDILSPPFKDEFNDEDNVQIINKINQFIPDVLFVGMTAPKQEKWVYKNKQHLNVKLIASIGAVFDFYAGTVKRPDDLWVKIGLEWLVRFMREPKRLFKRNVISMPIFLFTILKQYIKSIYLFRIKKIFSRS